LLSKNFRIKICGTTALTAVLYECETWFLTLREEYRLRCPNILTLEDEISTFFQNVGHIPEEWRRHRLRVF
jgi:hypothetical protein